MFGEITSFLKNSHSFPHALLWVSCPMDILEFLFSINLRIPFPDDNPVFLNPIFAVSQLAIILNKNIFPELDRKTT
jgi:hypothetical protein